MIAPTSRGDDRPVYTPYKFVRVAALREYLRLTFSVFGRGES